jgi:transposase
LIDLETHQLVFAWIVEILAEHGLVRGKTIGIDATTLEANAALRSIVRRDTGEPYQEFLKRLAQESGIQTPTRAQMGRLDRKRAKKGSDKEWVNPNDPDARIAKMKDGCTHLAYKAEHAVDMETGAVVAVTVQGADIGDTHSVQETLAQAVENLETVSAVMCETASLEVLPAAGPEELVTDKGYHSREVVLEIGESGIRTYVSEPERGRQRWPDQEREQKAVYGNRRRIRGQRGKELQRQRGEKLERVNAHLYETGGMRRVHLRGRDNVLKRLFIHVGGLNLGLLMRAMYGNGTPRGLQNGSLTNTEIAHRVLLCSFWIFLNEVVGQFDSQVTRSQRETPPHHVVVCLYS